MYCMFYILNPTHSVTVVLESFQILFILNKYNLAYYFCALLRRVGVIKLHSMCDLQNFEMHQECELSHVRLSVRPLHVSLIKLNAVSVYRTLVIHRDCAGERHSTTSVTGIPLPCYKILSSAYDGSVCLFIAQ